MAVTALLFALALGAGMVLTTSAEALIARHFQTANEALYAAEAVLEYAADALAAETQWDVAISGGRPSGFADGAPSGIRTLADGTTVSLDEVVFLANCGRPTACTAAEMDLSTPERPWGANNPRWQLYAWGPVADLPGADAASPYYVVVLVGDDGAENDDDPLRDGGPPANGEVENPGRHRVVLRAEALGPGGARRTVEVVVTRSVARLSWREVP